MALDKLAGSHAQVAQLVTLPRFPAAADFGAVTSFNLDQLVRERTAGKGYKPASRWTLCATCGRPVSTRDQVAIDADERTGKPVAVHHAVCR
jgi:hypothetical protein